LVRRIHDVAGGDGERHPDLQLEEIEGTDRIVFFVVADQVQCGAAVDGMERRRGVGRPAGRDAQLRPVGDGVDRERRRVGGAEVGVRRQSLAPRGREVGPELAQREHGATAV
jgi:hypothetical protein